VQGNLSAPKCGMIVLVLAACALLVVNEPIVARF